MVHVMPASDGSGSFTVTAVAVPGPPLETVMGKPTLVPASTGVASAVLVIVRLGDGMVRVVQFSPASPPTLFWSPSWVMTWNRYVLPGASASPFSSWRPLTFQRTSAPNPKLVPTAANPPVGV